MPAGVRQRGVYPRGVRRYRPSLWHRPLWHRGERISRSIPLTPEIQQRIVDAIAAGNTQHDAAEAAGISYMTFRRWMMRGKRASRGQFRTLLNSVKRAEAQAVLRNVQVIQDATPKNWTAAAWWLERKRGEDWGQQRELLRDLQKAVRELQKEIHGMAGKGGAKGK